MNEKTNITLQKNIVPMQLLGKMLVPKYDQNFKDCKTQMEG